MSNTPKGAFRVRRLFLKSRGQGVRAIFHTSANIHKALAEKQGGKAMLNDE
jgi:hypothetical protein